MQKRLYKSTKNIMVCGVCGGIGEFFGIDPSIVRILWVLLSFVNAGIGIIAYIACALILPKDIDINN
jgi:phage shock protein C